MDEPSKKIKGPLLATGRDAYPRNDRRWRNDLTYRKKTRIRNWKKTDTSHGEGFFLRPWNFPPSRRATKPAAGGSVGRVSIALNDLGLLAASGGGVAQMERLYLGSLLEKKQAR